MFMDKYFYFPQFGVATGAGVDIPTGVVNQFSFFEDFYGTVAGSISKVDTTTTAALASVTGTTSSTGEVTLTTNTTAGSSFAKGLSTVQFQAGKPASFVGRVKCAASTSYLVGLLPLSGDLFSSGFTGAAFWVSGTDVRYVVSGTGISLGAGTTTTSGTTLAAGSWLNCAIAWNGVNQILFYINGTLVGTVTSTALVGVAMYAGFGIQNAAAAQVISCDYLGVTGLR
jgi:hypothetical protein